MMASVRKLKMDMKGSRYWRFWCEDSGINMVEQDTEAVWEKRHRRIAELQARSAPQPPPDTQAEIDVSSRGSHSTPQILLYCGIDAVDDEARKRMNPNLYRAITQADVDDFITVLEHILDEEGLRIDQVFDQTSPIRNTYLHVAASVGSKEIVHLIAHHFLTLITKRNFNGDTALHLAARAGHWRSMEMLLREYHAHQQVHRKHFLLRMTNEKGNTALHEALLNLHSDSEIACCLIKEDPEAAFYLNNELQSPLTLAAKAGDTNCVSLILSFPEVLGKMIEQVKAGESPVHAAISSQEIGVLKVILSEAPGLIHFTDAQGRFPVHFAASQGYDVKVGYILDRFAGSEIQRDKNGLLPIHWASIMGQVRVIDKLLQHCPHPRELLDPNGCNILHLAAKAGKREVLGYIFKNPTYEELINMQDKQGNMPLHLAATHFHPRFIVDLTWRDTKTDVTVVNDKGMTAHDAFADNLRDTKADVTVVNDKGITALDAFADKFRTGYVSRTRKKLTWMSLEAGGDPDNSLSVGRKIPKEIFQAEDFKDSIATLILVSTLVATVTFAAGFTMPGGYNNSGSDEGLATLLEQRKFHLFVFCDTIAMYSSIIAAIVLIWAQIGNMTLIIVAINLALPIMGIALTMMSLAFMAGVSVVVSKLKWLDNVILIMGMTSLAINLVALFSLVMLPMSSNRLLRYVSYYPFSLLCYVSGSDS